MVKVTTVAATQLEQPEVDVLLFDEAYQTTFAYAAEAAENASQVFMVGDPGQIGPVVVSNTSLWERYPSAPHRRAPEVFAGMSGAKMLRMGNTYRLGESTVKVVSHLYDFEFSSERRAVSVVDHNSNTLPEISCLKINEPEDIASLPLMRQIVDRVEAAVGSWTVNDAGDSFVLGAEHVAIVVAHNDQSDTLRVLLDERGLGDVSVGTADSLQGAQWHVVVSLDPLVGHQRASDFQATSGRLCVMLSRHIGHLLWVYDARAVRRLRELGTDDAMLGVQVRKALVKEAQRLAVAENLESLAG